MSTPETPTWYEEKLNYETMPNWGDWTPIFFQSTIEYLTYIHQNKVRKPFPADQRAVARDLILRARTDNFEGFDPKPYANDPALQDTFLQLISWRYSASNISQLLNQYQGLLEDKSDTEAAKLFEFVVTDGRREELIQFLTSEEIAMLFEQSIHRKPFDTQDPEVRPFYEQFFQRYSFPTFEDFAQYNAKIVELFQAQDLIDEIEKNLYDTLVSPLDSARTALKLFIHLKTLFKEDRQGLTLALKRLGIPTQGYEEAINTQDLSAQNLMQYSKYIGRYFSSMNSPYERD